MKDAYTGAWKDEEKADWYQAKIRNATVLVIDDPGKEHNGEGAIELSRTILDDVIRHRMAASMPTIITSNDTPEEFRLRYGGNVDSLISERMLAVPVDGDDWRPNMYSTSQDELAMGITRPIVVS
jgi:DNA replication protein DnaC